MKMFAVYADYRGPDYAKHPYYVRAEDKRQAKVKFAERISWLKIYSVEPVPDEQVDEIVSQPYKYLTIGGNDTK